ncbi:MAG: hypothetical protein LKF37_13180 [Lentilactobacillus diolivorans]|jgi:hypothetical protein|nr:hypothetical protein [Lentilactobacillus diolivorans]RRG04077.1 MAG: hypothetical protein DUD34_04105 [Lactobacillus sp.]
MISRTLMLSVMATLGIGITSATVLTQPAQAAKKYRVLKAVTKSNLPYHAKTKRSAYIYDVYHMHKVHNLKNYPKTTWRVSQSLLMQPSKKGKKAVYYFVTSANGKVSGIVWRGYLKAGVNPDADN